MHKFNYHLSNIFMITVVMDLVRNLFKHDWAHAGWSLLFAFLFFIMSQISKRLAEKEKAEKITKVKAL